MIEYLDQPINMLSREKINTAEYSLNTLIELRDEIMEKVENYRLENQQKNIRKISKIKESAEYTLNKQKKMLIDEANAKVA